MISVVVWKKALMDRSHAGQEHVVCPDDERHEADEDHRVDHRPVAPQRLADIVGDDLGDDAHGRQDQHVNLGMGQEPEQVLPEQRAAAAGDLQNSVVDEQPAGQEEARASQAVHELHDPRQPRGAGKPRSRRKAVTSWAQTKKGSLKKLKPGARSWKIVVMKLIEPNSDEVIRHTMPMSQKRLADGGDISQRCIGTSTPSSRRHRATRSCTA